MHFDLKNVLEINKQNKIVWISITTTNFVLSKCQSPLSLLVIFLILRNLKYKKKLSLTVLLRSKTLFL